MLHYFLFILSLSLSLFLLKPTSFKLFGWCGEQGSSYVSIAKHVNPKTIVHYMFSGL